MQQEKPEPTGGRTTTLYFLNTKMILKHVPKDKHGPDIIALDKARFYYWDTSQQEVRRLEKRFKDRRTGLVNWEAFAQAFLQRVLVRWEGVCDSQGREIPFSKAMIRRLPVKCRVFLLSILGADERCHYMHHAWQSSMKGGAKPVRLSRKHIVERTVLNALKSWKRNEE